MRRRVISAHEVLLRHPWACNLWMSGRPSGGPDALRGRGAPRLPRRGFPEELTYHAFHVIQSHVMGFTMYVASFDFDVEELERLAADFLETFPADEYPDLADHIGQHAEPGDEHEGTFEFGLDLVLDGLERLRDARSIDRLRRRASTARTTSRSTAATSGSWTHFYEEVCQDREDCATYAFALPVQYLEWMLQLHLLQRTRARLSSAASASTWTTSSRPTRASRAPASFGRARSSRAAASPQRESADLHAQLQRATSSVSGGRRRDTEPLASYEAEQLEAFVPDEGRGQGDTAILDRVRDVRAADQRARVAGRSSPTGPSSAAIGDLRDLGGVVDPIDVNVGLRAVLRRPSGPPTSPAPKCWPAPPMVRTSSTATSASPRRPARGAGGAPADLGIPLPDDVSDEIAVMCGIPGSRAGCPSPGARPCGRTTASARGLGATGTVRSVAVQAAKLLGAGRVVAAGRNPGASEACGRVLSRC